MCVSGDSTDPKYIHRALVLVFPSWGEFDRTLFWF
jgi:hypothetical protein